MQRWLERTCLIATLAGMPLVHEAWGAPITIGNTQALAFGKFASGSGGTITVSPSGERTATGGVMLVSSSGGAAAGFSIAGDPNLTYAVTLPGSGAVSGSGGQTMSLSHFSSNLTSGGQLNASGQQTLSIGATLSVGANQTPDSYSSSFVVFVDYN